MSPQERLFVHGRMVRHPDDSALCSMLTFSIVQWWNGSNEPWFGDHNAILSPFDNYIYVYGGLLGPLGNAVFLARVPQAKAAKLAAYEYWNGTAFSSQRLRNPTTDQAVIFAGQGTIVWNPYYQKFLYFQPGCPGDACILVQAANQPWGPWSDSLSVFGNGDTPDGYGMYAPSVLSRWSDPAGKYLVVMYTGFYNHLQIFNMVSAQVFSI